VILNRFKAFENLSASDDINRAWENIQEKIKTSTKESLGLHKLKRHKPRIEEECLRFFSSKEVGIGSEAEQCRKTKKCKT
jgi:hypothetical protein